MTFPHDPAVQDLHEELSQLEVRLANLNTDAMTMRLQLSRAFSLIKRWEQSSLGILRDAARELKEALK